MVLSERSLEKNNILNNSYISIVRRQGGVKYRSTSQWGISEMSLHIVVTHKWCHLPDGILEPDLVSNFFYGPLCMPFGRMSDPPMGAHNEEIIKLLIYSTLTFDPLPPDYNYTIIYRTKILVHRLSQYFEGNKENCPFRILKV